MAGNGVVYVEKEKRGDMLERYLSKYVREGNVEGVTELLSESIRKGALISAMEDVAALGNVEMVKAMLPAMTGENDCSAALTCAARNGHKDVVELLVKNTKQERGALSYAVVSGDKDIVELMLPRANGSEEISLAFRTAVELDNVEIADRLAPISDLNIAKTKPFSKPELDAKIDTYIFKEEAKLQREELQSSTVQIPPSFNQCVDHAKSESQGAIQAQRAQARRL